MKGFIDKLMYKLLMEMDITSATALYTKRLDYEHARTHFKDIGIWDEIKHQSPEEIVHCWKWRQDK